MKKVSFLFSLLLVLAFLMSACATPGEEDTGELEGTDIFGTEESGIATLPAEETEVGGAGGAGGVGAATSTPLTTEAVSPSPMATAAATEPITGTSVTTPTGEEDISRLSNLLDLDIQGQDGEEIAEVEDAVLDLCAAQTPYLIAGFGGFLEIGETEVAVPWDSLTFSTEDDDGDGDADPVVVLDATKEQLENAPGFDPGELDFSNPDWDAELRTFWETQIEGTGTTTDTTGVQATQTVTGTPGAEAAVAADRCVVLGETLLDDFDVEMAGAGAAGTPGADVTAAGGTPSDEATGIPMGGLEPGTGTPAAGGTPGAGETGIPMGGLEPAGAQNQVVGDVEDVILDPETGEVRYLVISVDILDMGGNWVLVPPEAFALWDTSPDDDDTNPDSLVLNISQEDLSTAPTFEPDALPDTSVEGWDADLQTFWSGIDMDVETEPAP